MIRKLIGGAAAIAVWLIQAGAVEACTASDSLDTARRSRGSDAYKVARDVSEEVLDTHREIKLPTDKSRAEWVTIHVEKTEETIEAAAGTIMGPLGSREAQVPTGGKDSRGWPEYRRVEWTASNVRERIHDVISTPEQMAEISGRGAWRDTLAAGDMKTLQAGDQYYGGMKRDWNGNAHGPIVSTDGAFRWVDHMLVHALPFNPTWPGLTDGTTEPQPAPESAAPSEQVEPEPDPLSHAG